jgi:hypothetical protein
MALSLHEELSSSGLTGRSSTPRPLDLFSGVSGTLDHALSAMMTIESAARPYSSIKCASAFPRRDAPELCRNVPPIEGVGNAGCPVHPQPRV